MEKSKYLIRPNSATIFEIDPSNGCYRTYSEKVNENRQQAYRHFTYENLTRNYGYLPIKEEEIPIFKLISNDYYEALFKYCENDGHGGQKEFKNFTANDHKKFDCENNVINKWNKLYGNDSIKKTDQSTIDETVNFKFEWCIDRTKKIREISEPILKKNLTHFEYNEYESMLTLLLLDLEDLQENYKLNKNI